MWAKNLLFIGMCLCGLIALAGTVLLGDKRPAADEFKPWRYEKDEFRSVVDQVDAEFRERWQWSKLEPTPKADDLTIARRLSLGLTGTVPSLEEIRELQRQKPEHRIGWWVSHLLEDPRYADYVAERFARAFVGVENGPFLVYRRDRFHSWLSEQLEENRPYDQIVRELITAQGIWTSRPEVNFITVTIDQNNGDGPDEIKLAARVSRAFLGVRIDCVQCHDDNLGGDWKQTDFHELASFFAGAKTTLTGVRDEARKDYEYKYLHAEEEVVVPKAVPFADELLPEHGTPRTRLARWATHRENKAFARAAVNRVWALMFGQPLEDPIDNIPLEGPYSPGLETLAEDFAANRYDLRRLIRVIAATEVFQRDSRDLRPGHEVTPKHDRHLAAFPMTRLRPDQVAGALLQSCNLKTIDAESHVFVKIARFGQQNDFVRRYGDTGEDEFDDRGGTIPQRLVMMNGNLLRERTQDNFLSNASTRIAALAPDDKSAVEIAYLAVLTREPTFSEAEHFEARLANKTGGDRNRAMEDLYWTLLNSTEFSWNH